MKKEERGRNENAGKDAAKNTENTEKDAKNDAVRMRTGMQAIIAPQHAASIGSCSEKTGKEPAKSI